MKKITPCLWFDNEAEQAAKFYVSIFPNSKIKHVEKYTVDTPSNSFEQNSSKSREWMQFDHEEGCGLSV